MMKTTRHLPSLFVIAALGSGSAWADTPINLTHEAAPDAHIRIINVKGSLTITAWDSPQVQVGGHLGDGAKPLTIDGNRNDLTIKVEAQKNTSGWFNWKNDTSMSSTTLEVRVPKGAMLDVNVVSAPVTIDGIDGGTISVNTVSGRTRINARAPSIDVQSVSGNVELAGQASKVSLQTVSGDILAPNVSNEAELQTVSGGAQVNGGPWHKLSISTVSGDLQASGGIAPGGSCNIDSMSGDVQLSLPAKLSAKLHGSTFSGDLRSDFGTVSKPDHGPGSSVETTIGAGDGKISVETFSGDLRIKQQD